MSEKSGRVLADMHRLWIWSLAPQNKQVNNNMHGISRGWFFLSANMQSLEARANKYPEKTPNDNSLQNN